MRRILSRRQGTPTEVYWNICIRWRNAEGGLEDKQMGDFILTMGLMPPDLELWKVSNPDLFW